MMKTYRSKPTFLLATRSAFLALALAAAASATSITNHSGAPETRTPPSSRASVIDWDSYRCGPGWNETGFPGKPPMVPPGLENPRHESAPPTPMSSVPEPGSMALMAIGLLGFAGVRRYRRGAAERRSK